MMNEDTTDKLLRRKFSQDAPYYPNILLVREGTALYGGTYIRIERDGKWYKVLCVEAAITNDAAQLLVKIMNIVYRIQWLYRLTGNDNMEKIDELQIPERERLLEIMIEQQYGT